MDSLKILNCPDNRCKEVNIDGYRWTYADIKNELNFIPAAIVDQRNNRPRRFNSEDDYMNCSYCGLSMFISSEMAKNKFTNFPKHIQNLLGYTHLSKGKLTDAGKASKPDESGHFDLFEFENIDLSKSFKIIDTLI